MHTILYGYIVDHLQSVIVSCLCLSGLQCLLSLLSMPIQLAIQLVTLFCACKPISPIYIIQLPIVHHPYSYGSMLAYCLLWLPSLPSVLPSLLYTAAYLVDIITTSMQLSLHYLLSLPMLLSAMLTYSFIICLIYIAIQSAMPTGIY